MIRVLEGWRSVRASFRFARGARTVRARRAARRRPTRLARAPARPSGNDDSPAELAARTELVDPIVAKLEGFEAFRSPKQLQAVVWYLVALATIELAPLVLGLTR